MRVILEVMHSVHAFPSSCTFMANVTLFSSLNLVLLIGIFEVNCVVPFKMSSEIASGWITMLKQRSLIKIETSCSHMLRKFMNCCRRCIVMPHQIIVQSHIGLKGCVKARTVLKTSTSLVGRKLLQTVHQQPSLLPLWRKTYDVIKITMGSGIPKSSLHLVLTEMLEKRKFAAHSMRMQGLVSHRL
jgi:hypothetical protein